MRALSLSHVKPRDEIAYATASVSNGLKPSTPNRRVHSESHARDGRQIYREQLAVHGPDLDASEL